MHTPQVQSVSTPCFVGTYDVIYEEKEVHIHTQISDTQRNKREPYFEEQ